MEFAVYRVYYRDGRKLGVFVDMLAGREEAEARVQNLAGEHEVVGLWTREIAEDDYGTVVFLADGGVEPGEAGREE